jgi:tetratricopeptide (TPR) repeat protein
MALAAKKRTDDMKKAADLQTALTQGRSALAGKDFSAVAKALAVAQKLGPDNVDVKTALRDLEQAQKQAAADSAALKRRKQEFDTLVATGKTALNAKNYPAALKALSSATTLMPDNTEAQDLFRRAQTESRQAEETLAKSKLQDLITTGLANIKSKNYDAAEKALRSAAQVDPKNSVIVQGLKDIEAGRNVQANEKLVANYKLVLAQGQKALQSNDFKNAIALANQALKLMPNDTGATNLLQQAQLGQTRLTSYQSAIQAGNNALKAKEYANAAKAFNEALKLFPNDATARAGLASAKKGPGPEPVKFDYNQSMQRGFTAENNLKYADALKAYQEALKAKPNDQQATARANFAQAIVHAEQAINNAMWVEAQREVDNALRLQPKNAHALKLQQRVKNKK